MSIPPWPRWFDEATASLVVADDRGAVRAVVRLEPRIDPALATDPTDRGVLARLGRAVHRLTGDPERRVWVARRGALFDGGTAVVDLPYGFSGGMRNGRGSGLRRVHRTGTIELRGRTYTLRHRSRRRTQIVRDGLDLGTLRRTGWYWRAHTGDGPLSCRARLELPMMDDDDLLAAVLAASVCGPPGRPGGLAAFVNEV